MSHVSLTAAEHKELARLVSRNLHLISEHLDNLAGIPGDYRDTNCKLFARIHGDLLKMQALLEKPPLEAEPPRH